MPRREALMWYKGRVRYIISCETAPHWVNAKDADRALRWVMIAAFGKPVKGRTANSYKGTVCINNFAANRIVCNVQGELSFLLTLCLSCPSVFTSWVYLLNLSASSVFLPERLFNPLVGFVWGRKSIPSTGECRLTVHTATKREWESFWRAPEPLSCYLQ